MASGDKYTRLILERIQLRSGFYPDPLRIPQAQWKRITDLAEALHQASVIEQMVRVEQRAAMKISSRISSRVRPSKQAELKQSLESLETLKGMIWDKCDNFSEVEEESLPERPIRGEGNHRKRGENLMKCQSCGGNISILAYNNYKCSGCGMGYSARDYLENLKETVENI